MPKKDKIGIFNTEMNKRQKKKREKKILLWELQRRDKPKDELFYNGEGYHDSTAGQAIRNAMRSKKNNA